MQTVPDVPKEFWLLGAGVALLGIAYLWAKGLKGAASGVVTGAGNVAAGLVDGIGNAGVAVTNAAGNAFQDITQAAIGVPKTNIDKCAADTAAGDNWAASFSCSAGKFLDYLFSPSVPPVVNDGVFLPVTAPGGGIVPATDYLLGGGNADYSAPFDTGIDPNSLLDPLLSYNPGSALGINAAPSDPVPFNTRPQIIQIAGIRG